jgi:hypothetical protein
MANAKLIHMPKIIPHLRLKYICGTLLLFIFVNSTIAQPEVEPWGNITGIRISGQLISFESSLRIVEDNWSRVISTARERQKPKYIRSDNKQIIETRIDSINFIETIEEVKDGKADANIHISSRRSFKNSEPFFVVSLPLVDYDEAVTKKSNAGSQRIYLNDFTNNATYAASGIMIISKTHRVQFDFDSTTDLVFRKSPGNEGIAEIYISLLGKGMQTDTSAEKHIRITARGIVDKKAMTLKLDASKEGRPFDGFGGNFRLQNPKADPQVINYCLENMRVAWGRIEFPWRFWQPDEHVDPVVTAKTDSLNQHVRESMEMATRLGKMGIPIILSAWFPPQWAVTVPLHMRPVNGVWGNPLDPEKINEIYKSITDYIIYLKDHYGVEIKLFSFNESDLGINIRQTPIEHDALIKGLGAYFSSHGLHTRMLLGDNSDATTYPYIYPALNDVETKPYIGAISFHSWRGWDLETLQKWKDASDKLNAPLIVGEGSIDAAAWNYPSIFEEQTYIMQEINLYIRLLAICQPLSILQWQLTSDYSPLAGGGIFGNNSPLHPTQRFWNFKQLASTPKGLFAMPIKCDRPAITVAALGDNKRKIYTIHIVNNGAARTATLDGLPPFIKSMKIFTTNKTDSVKRGQVVKVLNGKATFQLNSETFTTLIIR